MECLSCKSISGEQRISPGPIIFETEHWLVEHAYPSKLKGWVVLVNKRHIEALHDLTKEEFAELGMLCEKTTKILYTMLDCEKEYSVCFAELEGFNHIHFHIVPKPRDWPKELRGPAIFSMLKANEHDSIPKTEIKNFCEQARSEFERYR